MGRDGDGGCMGSRVTTDLMVASRAAVVVEAVTTEDNEAALSVFMLRALPKERLVGLVRVCRSVPQTDAADTGPVIIERSTTQRTAPNHDSTAARADQSEVRVPGDRGH
jgi:hypothetical protein